jgi:iron(III) transport system ATP-binding protein
VLTVRALAKRYANTHALAVDGVSFDLRDGEFYTLLGPSGCGKTTTLRSVAGLETPDAGEIEIAGTRVFGSGTNVPTQSREIAMVFQSYAIWPHLTVYGNVSFPLTMRRTDPAEVRRRTLAALEMVGLGELAERPAPLLSGGQQQRVALARAIVREAKLLLLDEPLSNLDAKLREQMRGELRSLQRRLGTTTLYVTHDQEEALAMSDRVAVMDRGRIVECGSPEELYLSPATPFVARFVGQADLVACTVLSVGADEAVAVAPWGRVVVRGARTNVLRGPAQLLVRPEHIGLAATGRHARGGQEAAVRESASAASNQVAGTVEATEFSGRLVEYRVRVPGLGTPLRVQSLSGTRIAPGTEVELHFPPERCVLLPDETPASPSKEENR